MNKYILSIFLPLITIFIAYYITDNFFDINCSIPMHIECVTRRVDGLAGNINPFDLKMTGMAWFVTLIVIMVELLIIWKKDKKIVNN